MATTFNTPSTSSTATAATTYFAAPTDLLSRSEVLKGIDLALGEDLREKTSPSTLSTITTTTTAPLLRHPQMLSSAMPAKPVCLNVLTSPRVSQELTTEETVQIVQQVLSFTFPTSGHDDEDRGGSVFSGYIFVNGKQVEWTRAANRSGSRITIALREERDLLSTDWLDTKVML